MFFYWMSDLMFVLWNQKLGVYAENVSSLEICPTPAQIIILYSKLEYYLSVHEASDTNDQDSYKVIYYTKH